MELKLRADKPTKLAYEVIKFCGQHNHPTGNFTTEEVIYFSAELKIFFSNHCNNDFYFTLFHLLQNNESNGDLDGANPEHPEGAIHLSTQPFTSQHPILNEGKICIPSLQNLIRHQMIQKTKYSVPESEFEVRYQFCVNALKDLVTPNKQLHQKCLDILDNAIDVLSSSNETIISSSEVSRKQSLNDSSEFFDTFGLTETPSLREEIEDLYREGPEIINGVVAHLPRPANDDFVIKISKPSSSNVVEIVPTPGTEPESCDSKENEKTIEATPTQNLPVLNTSLIQKDSLIEEDSFIEEDSLFEDDSFIKESAGLDEVSEEHDVIVKKKEAKRGRPLNSAVLTAVGTRRKNLEITSFVNLHPAQKRIHMINWILTFDAAENAVEGAYKIDETALAVISDSFFDAKVDINIIKNDFKESAFKKFESFLKSKKSEEKKGKKIFSCGKCKKLVEGMAVCCQLCLLRFDFECTGLKKQLRQNTRWYCAMCRKKFRS